MKRRLLLYSLVVCLVVLAITPTIVGAGGDKNRHRWRGERFGLVGTIAELGDGTITVDVWMGSWVVKDYIGESVVVITDADTRFLSYGHEPGEFITFDDLVLGDAISVSGILSDGQYLAVRVTMGVPLVGMVEE